MRRTAEPCQVELKLAGDRDALALWDIQRKAFAALLEKYQDDDTNPAAEPLERVQGRLDSPEREYWFIVVNGQQAGFIGVKHVVDALSVSPIGVLPEWQGKGIGHKALALLEANYPENPRWVLGTIAQEPGLRSFYESLGYRPTGEQWQLKPGMDEIGYEKIRRTEKG